jgi:hypothetical protein
MRITVSLYATAAAAKVRSSGKKGSAENARGRAARVLRKSVDAKYVAGEWIR